MDSGLLEVSRTMNSRACVELQNLWDSNFPASKAQFNSWQVDRLAALIDNLYTLLSDTTKQRQSTRNTYVNSAVASLIRSCTSLIQISSQEFREKKANEERIKKNTQNLTSMFTPGMVTQNKKRSSDLFFSQSKIPLSQELKTCPVCGHGIVNLSMTDEEIADATARNQTETIKKRQQQQMEAVAGDKKRKIKKIELKLTLNCYCGDQYCYNEDNGGQCTVCQIKGPKLNSDGVCICSVCKCNCNATTSISNVRILHCYFIIMIIS
jgi:hypothetical protein